MPCSAISWISIITSRMMKCYIHTTVIRHMCVCLYYSYTVPGHSTRLYLIIYRIDIKTALQQMYTLEIYRLIYDAIIKSRRNVL
jgi:hypothetical protein